MKLTAFISVKKVKQILSILFFVPLFAVMPEASEGEVLPMVTKSFLITKSTKNYSEAKHFAQNLALRSGIKLDLRGLYPHAQTGLSEPKEVCVENGFEAPCYVPRGRYDDGTYISIEYSSAYNGFAEGYYIVMVASGDISNKVVSHIKQYVPDAYVKKSAVYIGCIH